MPVQPKHRRDVGCQSIASKSDVQVQCLYKRKLAQELHYITLVLHKSIGQMLKISSSSIERDIDAF